MDSSDNAESNLSKYTLSDRDRLITSACEEILKENFDIAVKMRGDAQHRRNLRDLVIEKLPRFFIDGNPKGEHWHSQQNEDKIEKRLVERYDLMPLPKFQIKRSPDLDSFLTAASKVFVNVIDVRATTYALVRWMRELLDQKGDQVFLYLFSRKEGGIGKTLFMNSLKAVLEDGFKESRAKVGGISGTSFIRNGFLDPDKFKNHVTTLEECNLDEEDADLLNQLIDHSETDFNRKYGGTGTFRCQSMFIAASNRLQIANRNDRRYVIIEYYLKSMLNYPKDPMYKEHIKTMLRCCPTEDQLDISILRPPELYAPANVNTDILDFICKNRSFARSRIGKLVDSQWNDKTIANGKVKSQIGNFISTLESHGLLKHNKSSVFNREFKWSMIADLIDKLGLLSPSIDIDDPITVCANEWRQLHDELCPPDPDFDSKIKHSKEVYENIAKFDTLATLASDQSLGPHAQWIGGYVMNDGSRPSPDAKSADVRPKIMAFECDDPPLEWQKQNLMKSKAKHLLCEVFSGGRSIHFQVEIPDDVSIMLADVYKQDPDHAKKMYEFIYNDVASQLFFDTSLFDSTMKTWLRKCRCPEGCRDGKIAQTTTWHEGAPLDWKAILARMAERIEQASIVSKMAADSAEMKDARADNPYEKQAKSALDNPIVKSYLDTSYPLIKGNGNSERHLYRALCAIASYDDDAAKAEVYAKARSEHWSQKDLDRKYTDAVKFVKTHRRNNQ